jgi:plastocyanin
MRPTLAVLGIVTVLALATFLALSAGPAAAKDNPVNVGPFYFCSEDFMGEVCETDVTAGDSVTWTVTGGTHTVSQCTDQTFATCTGGFDSSTVHPSDTFVHTFAEPGTYYYHCDFHPTEMKGKIVVAAATGTPTPTLPPSSTGTPAATTAAALPVTGGEPGSSSGSAWVYGLLALGGVMLSGSALSFALARRR